MPRSYFLTLLLCLSAPAAWAECVNGPELYSCSFSQGKKAVHVCQDGKDYTYAYGRIGAAPELLLKRSLEDIHFTPWPGIGRTYWEEVQFYNKSVSYVINVTADRLSGEDSLPEGELSVMEGEERLAWLICDAGSVRANFTPLANAWHEAGYQ